MAIATTMNGEESMSYDIKVVLMGMAKYAVEAKIKKMYDYAIDLATVEGLVLPSYEEAVAKAENAYQTPEKN